MQFTIGTTTFLSQKLVSRKMLSGILTEREMRNFFKMCVSSLFFLRFWKLIKSWVSENFRYHIKRKYIKNERPNNNKKKKKKK